MNQSLDQRASSGLDNARVQIQDVHSAYGSTPVLKGLSFSVQAGELLALLGQNGAGKTTTFRILAGLTRPDTGTVTIRGERTGTFYAKYVATNGPTSAPGLVRIDIKDPEQNSGNPIAVRDVALLPAGQDVLVNVLGNDSDPAGGVLVLTGAEVPDDAPFTVSVERNSFVRITDVRGLTEPKKVHTRSRTAVVCPPGRSM